MFSSKGRVELCSISCFTNFFYLSLVRRYLPSYIFNLDCFIFSTLGFIFLSVFILTQPVNFPCARVESEAPGETHDFRQSVDDSFYMSLQRGN